MKTYFAALLTFTLTVSAIAQTTDDNNAKSPNRHHTRPPYSGPVKHHSKTRRAHVVKAGTPTANPQKPTSDHIVAH